MPSFTTRWRSRSRFESLTPENPNPSPNPNPTPQPFVLGFKGPIDCLRTTGGGVTVQLIPRPGGEHATEEETLIQTEDEIFAIHFATG